VDVPGIATGGPVGGNTARIEIRKWKIERLKQNLKGKSEEDSPAERQTAQSSECRENPIGEKADTERQAEETQGEARQNRGKLSRGVGQRKASADSPLRLGNDRVVWLAAFRGGGV
jgi:hypothetical protein